jgi:flagellar biosynthesis protein FlhG
VRNFEATPAGDGPARARRDPAPEPCIWAIGGGKGGVGKSVVASNLAIALAAGGPRCVVIDADLGASNAHTLLGVPRPPRTLSHFLNGEVRRLEEVMCPTTVPAVALLSGARALLEVANIKHSQKKKFIRHIKRLEVAHVVLDLGAGSSFNVLDFFLAAQRGVLVVTPEPTAIENAYHFLKAAFFRSLNHAARQSPLRETLQEVLAEARRRAATPRELVARAAQLHPEVGRLLQERVRAFEPMLIVNQVEQPAQRKVGPEIAAACRVHLGSELQYLGALEHDARVPEAVCRQLPVLQLYPGCAFATSLRSVVDGLRGRAFAAGRDALREAQRGRDTGWQLAVHGLVDEADFEGANSTAPPLPLAPLPPLDTSQPGSYLRRCREELGLSMAVLSERTCIRRLDRIENERFEDLPPEPYLRGYVLQYAHALGVPEADALATSYVDRYRRAAARRPATVA